MRESAAQDFDAKILDTKYSGLPDPARRRSTVSTHATAPTKQIDPMDFLDIDALLSDEERLIRDTVRAFVASASCRTSASGSRRRDPAASWRRSSASSACSACTSRATAAPGASATAYGLACMELEAGDSRRAQPRLGAGLAGDVRDLALGLRGAEAGVAAADGRRRGDRLLRPDRARRRLRPRLDAHPRAARRRRLGPARHEDVDHQRLGRRRRGRVGADRRRHPRLPRRRRARRASPRRTSTRSSRCARRSPPSCCSTTCACPPTRCCPRRPRCAARCRA